MLLSFHATCARWSALESKVLGHRIFLAALCWFPWRANVLLPSCNGRCVYLIMRWCHFLYFSNQFCFTLNIHLLHISLYILHMCNVCVCIHLCHVISSLCLQVYTSLSPFCVCPAFRWKCFCSHDDRSQGEKLRLSRFLALFYILCLRPSCNLMHS